MHFHFSNYSLHSLWYVNSLVFDTSPRLNPTVPDSIIQAAMDYACGSGVDCNYWQNTKGSGGTCGFGGTAMLVTVDPSKISANSATVDYRRQKEQFRRPMSTAFYFRGIRTCTFARCDSI
ncbi:hypothetical protein CRYUN_Cryun20dG0116100 [Craigia yunnanensis]